jgi:hypothetical protein
MRILVATDAWHPQVNGVVRTLTMMAGAAHALGIDISFLTPLSFRTFAMPSYPDLRVALPGAAKIARLIVEARPDNIHIAKDRSDLRCAAIAASADFRSRRVSIPDFRNTSRRAFRYPNPGYGRRCAGFMERARR